MRCILIIFYNQVQNLIHINEMLDQKVSMISLCESHQ
ncbi:unnamed protein product [Paramecium sonneborni]|uniref:Uncharacterized protein n=1 Tax=Paramecium sonneborni TaxID=65129 RepID=A0A8S1PQY6_9CILI|nr:unnamed protein product [Paramecium sonneborni]